MQELSASEIIGKRATIVGFDTSAHDSSETPFVAHICLDIEDGPRLFFEAYPGTGLYLFQEPR